MSRTRIFLVHNYGKTELNKKCIVYTYFHTTGDDDAPPEPKKTREFSTHERPLVVEVVVVYLGVVLPWGARVWRMACDTLLVVCVRNLTLKRS